MPSYENPQFSATEPVGSAALHFELTQKNIKKLWHRYSSSATPCRVMVKTSWSTFSSRFKKKPKETVIPPPCVQLFPSYTLQANEHGNMEKSLCFIYPCWKKNHGFIYGPDGGCVPAMLVSRFDGRCWKCQAGRPTIRHFLGPQPAFLDSNDLKM